MRARLAVFGEIFMPLSRLVLHPCARRQHPAHGKPTAGRQEHIQSFTVIEPSNQQFIQLPIKLAQISVEFESTIRKRERRKVITVASSSKIISANSFVSFTRQEIAVETFSGREALLQGLDESALKSQFDLLLNHSFIGFTHLLTLYSFIH